MDLKDSLVKHDAKAELENTFIMRLPLEPAQTLRQLVRNGSMSLKDRLSIQIETDMRTATIRFDNWVLPGKVYDLPTITESLKTINKKTFYKTADICQILICKDGEDNSTTDEETSPNKKKRDPNKVDKKFLFPHGLTPPLKNARKRRFRKTMKKKFVDAPEIEKEVKRLLRVDNEAVSVHYEIVMDEDETKGNAGIQEACQDSSSMPTTEANNQSVAEHDIFGEAVSDSDEENHDRSINVVSEEDSRSRMSDSMYQSGESRKTEDMTEFKVGFLRQHQSETPQHALEQPRASSPRDDYQQQLYQPMQQPQSSSSLSRLDVAQAEELLESYRQQMSELRSSRTTRESEIDNIVNPVLKQRFQYTLDQCLEAEREIERKYNELRGRLEATYMMADSQK